MKIIKTVFAATAGTLLLSGTAFASQSFHYISDVKSVDTQ